MPLLALIISYFTGSCLLQWFWGPLAMRRCPTGLRVALSAGLGLGASSVTFYVWLAMQPSPVYQLILTDIVGMAIVWWLKRQREQTVEGRYARSLDAAEPKLPLMRRCGAFANALLRGKANRAGPGLLVVAVLVAAGMAAFIFVTLAIRNPYGGWGSLTVWLTKARFLASGEPWPNGFGPLTPWTQPDYPLLWPSTVARLWVYGENFSSALPAMLAGIFPLLILGLLAAALGYLRSVSSAAAAALLLLSAPCFLLAGATQSADLPLSFFMLAAVVFLALGPEFVDEGAFPLLAAGLAAGFAAWTKNEGLFFAFNLLLAAFVVNYFHAGAKAASLRTLALLVGMFLPLYLVLNVKTSFAATPALFAALPEEGGRFARFAQLGHYAWLPARLGSILRTSVFNVPALALGGLIAILLGLRRRWPEWTIAAATATLALLLQLLGYLVVLFILPGNLELQLPDLAPRLLLHLYPSLLFVLFLSLRTPGYVLRK